MKEEKYKNYLRDLVTFLDEKVTLAKTRKSESSLEDSAFHAGYLLAYHEVIDLVKQQAKAFNIKEEEIGIANIDPDSTLL